MSRMVLCGFASVLVFAFVALGQQAVAPAAQPSVVRATGEGVLNVAPDRALVDVGVVTQAATAQAAGAENARVQTAVIAAMRQILGPQAEIRTISYAVTPNYRYPRDAAPVITGYTATNVVRATVDNLEQVGPVIDAALRAGANRIQGIQFTVRDEQAVRTRALRAAAQRARANAEALAGALNLRIVRVMSVEETGAVVVPVRDVMLARAELAAPAAPPTPVEPGTIEVRANVTVTLQVQ